MAALRFAPLFALPVLGGVLLAFVIATFQDDPDPVSEAVTANDDQLEEQPDTVIEPTAQPQEEDPVVAEQSPAQVPDPLANVDLNGPFDVDDFSAYWRENLPPSLAEILENGFGAQRD